MLGNVFENGFHLLDFYTVGCSMNPNYNTTITIYNCLRAADNPDGHKDIWIRSVLHNCFYKNVIGRTEYADKDPKMSSTYTVRIPASEKYKPYHEWIRLDDQERSKYFTCSQKELVVKGECEEAITGISPATSSQLLSRHKPDAFLITAFADNSGYKHAKHYRIGG